MGVPDHRIEIALGFDRKTPVTPLIKEAISNFMSMLFPAFDMHVGHLLHEGGKVAVAFGPQNKMPMIPLAGKMANSHPTSPQGFFDDSPQARKS